MAKTFKAWLKGSRLEWIDDVPDMGEQPFPVQVTLLENQPALEPQTRGQKMAEILEKLAATQVLGHVDPSVWQQEIRQDRPLPGQ